MNKDTMDHKPFSPVKFLLFFLLSAAVLFVCVFESKQPAEQTSSSQKLTVHFLDVGQGDSVFAELPDGTTMLVDSGTGMHGEGIIDYILREGYQKIDYLVATHPHSDHIGSMSYIVRHFEVGRVYLPEVTVNTRLYEDFLNALAEKNITVYTGKRGKNLVVTEDYAVNILAPVNIDEENLNNSSIVLRLTYGSNVFLLPGDAELSEMDSVREDIHADVLKAAHHGSSNAISKELLERIDPQIAVISCGRGNEYGHPHQETLALFREAGVRVFRTDTDQTVIVTSDGERLTVSTKNPSIKRSI